MLVRETRELSSTEVTENGFVDGESVFLETVPAGGHEVAGWFRAVESQQKEGGVHLWGQRGVTERRG